jgi:hypothetical protein
VGDIVISAILGLSEDRRHMGRFLFVVVEIRPATACRKLNSGFKRSGSFVLGSYHRPVLRLAGALAPAVIADDGNEFSGAREGGTPTRCCRALAQ